MFDEVTLFDVHFLSYLFIVSVVANHSGKFGRIFESPFVEYVEQFCDIIYFGYTLVCGSEKKVLAISGYHSCYRGSRGAPETRSQRCQEETPAERYLGTVLLPTSSLDNRHVFRRVDGGAM